MNNNPVNATDPTGHQCVGEPEECLEDDGTTEPGFPGTGGTVNNPGAGDCSGSGCQGEETDTDTQLTDALSSAFEYCPFGWVCEPIYDTAWEQLANLLVPPYVDGSKNELYLMYGFMAAGAEGITIVSTPDGRFVIYYERSEFGQTVVLGPNVSINASKGIIFGIVDPLDYSGYSVSGSPSFGTLSGSAWTTPDLKIKGVDGNGSLGVSLPGFSASRTYADPKASGQYKGFMLLFCRLVLGGCGR